MTDSELLETLERLVPQLGIELRKCDGEFTGAICRVNGKSVFLINSSLSQAKAIEVLCRELSVLDLTKVFVLPAVRDKIKSSSV